MNAPILFADISDPGETVIEDPALTGFFFYIGGATPHVWTPQQVARQTLRYAVQIWVRDKSRSGYAAGRQDGAAACDAGHAYAVPRGCRVVCDMETEVDSEYTRGFADAVMAAGGLPVIYGSASTIFGNLIWGGEQYWVADWTGSPHEYPHGGVWATQYADPSLDHLPWDLSEIASFNGVWDRFPPPPAPGWQADALAEAKVIASGASALVQLLAAHQ